MNQTPQSILKNTFGYDDFLSQQKEVIENVLLHKDTLAIMPTGGGKSLCYQIPALLLPGITIVVSPLIALMKDQIDQLMQLGVAAVTLNSSLEAREYFNNTEKIREGHTRLVYVAPETLLSERISSLLEHLQVDLLVIDEAHCISEWGHDFRPEYREIIKVRKRLQGVTCLALTATATQRVRADIKKSLGFQDHNEFISSFDRKNLIIEVVKKEKPLQQTVEMIQQFPGRSGIIYCFSRRQVDELANDLTRLKYSALPYHAGLDDSTRRKNQEAFIRDDANIIVATVAFGMGINKPDVRFVLHYDLPKSLEGYYQEIGRAGRDGQNAVCRLLFSYGDKNKIQFILREKTGKERLAAEEQFNALLHYVESPGCRRKTLLAYFGEVYKEKSCGMCDQCLALQDTLVDITIPAQKFMSCMKRSGEAFGFGHIADILIGVQSEKVLAHNHHSLPTFGIGKDWTKEEWQRLSDQLLSLNLIEKTGQFNVLKLTDAAMEALRTRQTITVNRPRRQPSLFTETRTSAPKIFGEPVEPKPVPRHTRMPEADNALYEILRQLRKDLADARQIPPYVIFPDRTLVEMAAYHPLNLNSLKNIHGVGTVRAERFGGIFIRAISEYCQTHNLKEIQKSNLTHVKSNDRGMKKKSHHAEIADEYLAGTPVVELAGKYSVLPNSIIGYLIQEARAGRRDPHPERLLELSRVTPSVRKKVLAAFRDIGSEFLKPVFMFMNETVDYNELRLLQCYFLFKNNQTSGGK